ncbi:MAG: signal peptidase II [Actinomycetota bacterium]|nr:signal peptidase II [Actinomycetota bacterium]
MGASVAADVGRGRRWALVAAIAAGVVVLDQVTKRWALQALDGGRIVDLVGTLRLRLVFNRGTAFGLGSRFAPVIAVLAVVVVVVLLRSGGALQGAWARTSLGLVLGGAVGNLIDRVVRAGGGFLGGEVVDFVDLQWWPVFNLADMAISAGSVLLILTAWRDPGLAPPEEAEAVERRARSAPDDTAR